MSDILGEHIDGDIVVGNCVLCKKKPAITAGYCKPCANERSNAKRHSMAGGYRPGAKGKRRQSRKLAMEQVTNEILKPLSPEAQLAYDNWDAETKHAEKMTDILRMALARGVQTKEQFHAVLPTYWEPVREAKETYEQINLPLRLKAARQEQSMWEEKLDPDDGGYTRRRLAIAIDFVHQLERQVRDGNARRKLG